MLKNPAVYFDIRRQRTPRLNDRWKMLGDRSYTYCSPVYSSFLKGFKHDYASATAACKLGQYAWPARHGNFKQDSNAVIKFCINCSNY